ncbi:MAG TPA: DUF4124 domain-containing protein [Steroidobacteraceae bacterium]|nr:DUF4124 domain-containing protein [Steroidobacteraceae bacterium]
MRNATPFLAVVLTSVCLASAAFAEKPTYKWTDEKGVVHYGDSVPAEYSQREQSILNKQGVVTQKQQAEMSPAEAADFAAQQKQEAMRRQHDMFLVSTYPSVKEIENVRDTRVEQINGQVSATETYIASLNSRLEGLKQRAMLFTPYNPKPGARRMPDDLAEEMVRVLSEQRTQHTALEKRRSELQTVMEQFDGDIRRFKELRTSAAARLNNSGAPKKQ